jgi:hypothetical protein
LGIDFSILFRRRELVDPEFPVELENAPHCTSLELISPVASRWSAKYHPFNRTARSPGGSITSEEIK